jgi:GT2 family glycosyltransferase
MNINPLVSIIVRTKDRPKLLTRALQSIAAQTYRPIEVILVNNRGCELDIGEIKSILGNISLNYVRLEKNTGRAHGGNIGIDNTKGKYIGFLDDDNEFYPEHVETVIGPLLRGPFMIAYADAEDVSLELNREGDLVETARHLSYHHEFIPEVFFIQNYIPFMCLLFDKKIFDGIRFDESFELFEDWDLLTKLSQEFPFAHIGKVTSKYLQWSNEFQISRKTMVESSSKEIYLKILRRNIGNVTPEVLYTYCAAMVTEKERILSMLSREPAVKERIISDRAEMANEKEKTGTERDKLKAEINALEISRLVLLRKLIGLQNQLAEITSSLSWKMIRRYQKIKEKVAPIGSKRRALYDLILKSMKVIDCEGMTGFFRRVERRLGFNQMHISFKFRMMKSRQSALKIEGKTTAEFVFSRNPVYIVMPVYNGYDYLGTSLNSVFKNTDLSYHSLLLIDDKSYDQRVIDYLVQLQQQKNGRRIEILFNPENRGFIKTINSGMQLVPGDVIILHSDTVVTKGWVEKLQRAAYSKPKVATATPLSNYVAIHGIPEPFTYNQTPLPTDIESFGSFLERISLRYYPEVPAGVGFCMYIKRSVLDDLGYFDDLKFEKGYAMETDFCIRALKKGYIHVLDDATYVCHISSVSFESINDPAVFMEKNLMIDRNLETLKRLHPEYLDLVERALRETLAPVDEYLRLRLTIEEEYAKNTLCYRSKT